MPLTALSAVRQAEDPSCIDLSWQFDGTADEFYLSDYGDLAGDQRTAQINLNVWLEKTVTLTAYTRDPDTDEPVQDSEMTATIGMGAIPAITAPGGITALRDLEQSLTIQFNIPDYVVTFPQIILS